MKMKNSTKQINQAINQGIKRIDQIKKEISSCRAPKLARVEVYEMWSNAFGDTENNQ